MPLWKPISTINAIWTPGDGSGASLTFTGVAANYSKVGRIIVLEFDLTYPSTADGSNASINGLPMAAATLGYVGMVVPVSGGTITGTLTLSTVGGSTTNLNIYQGNGSGSHATNANLSLARLRGLIWGRAAS